MKYRKKPVVIEAVKFDEKEWWENRDKYPMVHLWDLARTFSPFPCIETLEGAMKVSHGDYIIKGVQGEFYPCKPDIFEATYEKVE